MTTATKVAAWILACAIWFVGYVLCFGLPAPASPTCMSIREARAEYPRDHLYKRDGCWDSKRKRRIVPIDLSDKRIADANGMVIAPIDPPPPPEYDKFVGPHEPMLNYMVPEIAFKKSDRLDAVFEEEAKPEPPKIVKTETIVEHPKGSMRWDERIVLWVLILSSASTFAVITAYIISRTTFPTLPDRWRKLLGGRRKTDADEHYTRIPVARVNRQLKGTGERAIAGGDGPRDQQPYIYPRHIFDEWWGINERGHGRDPSPPASRPDDFSALGAWAKSRGLRPETPPATASEIEPSQSRQARKRNRWWKRFSIAS